MIGIKIADGLTPLTRKLEKTLPISHAKALLRAAEYAAGEIRRQIYAKFKGRTGEMARSYKAMFLETGKGDIVTGAVSDLEYAAIQNRGGEIQPRNRQYLAVPVGPGKNLPVGAGPRDVPGLRLIPMTDGRALLAKVKKRKARPEGWFVLQKTVRLEGKKYIEAAYGESKEEIREILERATQGTIDGAG